VAIGVGDHIPVLTKEVLKFLLGRQDGTYVDATFGCGGHCRALLQKLAPSARLVAMDRDPDAVALAQVLAVEDSRVLVVHRRFAELDTVLTELEIVAVDGVVLDIGVSSPQLDDPTRGFSFLNDGPLDMRMDPTSGMSAADWINSAQESEITRVLFEFGEERHARRVARAIVKARPITTTGAFAETVSEAIPHSGRSKRHPATKAFQAVRIVVNSENEELARGLDNAFDCLRPGGRLAVISFHSLEDRRVKHKFRELSMPPPLPRRLPVRAASISSPGKLIAGPVRASASEVAANPRARSAMLRVIEKTGDVDPLVGAAEGKRAPGVARGAR